jgi:peptidoglycan/xylan/chitin deacetylase (PgdA/CDA1 family)
MQVTLDTVAAASSVWHWSIDQLSSGGGATFECRARRARRPTRRSGSSRPKHGCQDSGISGLLDQIPVTPVPLDAPSRPALDRLLSPIAPVAVRSHAGGGEARWLRADGKRFLARPHLRPLAGEEVLRFELPDGGHVAACRDADGVVTAPFDLDEAYLDLVLERWRETQPPRALTGWQIALFYRLKRLIPRAVQVRARRHLIHRQEDPEFPRWPLDDGVLDLLKLYARLALLGADAAALPFRWFWPDGLAAAVVLTHDVESAAGLRLAVELADLEEERGLRSSFNVVADWYPIDRGIVRELDRRGFELGVHGVHHDRSLFSSRAEFEAQLPVIGTFAESLGAVGFRSPATHRVIDWLGELPVAYDCSVPHSDPFEPQPGGCCSLWPFFLGDLVELPYTLPQDNTLLTLLGHETIAVWERLLAAIVERHGLVQILTHPDRGYLAEPDRRARYVEFLDLVRERTDAWRALPRDVAAWWRERDAGAPTDRLRIGVAALDGDVVFSCTETRDTVTTPLASWNQRPA